MSCKDYGKESKKSRQEKTNTWVAIKNIYCLTYQPDSAFLNKRKDKQRNKTNVYKKGYKKLKTQDQPTIWETLLQ